MTTPDVISVVAASISAIAVIVSEVALVLGARANRKANRTAREANEIQGRLLAIEEERESQKARQCKRANLILSLERSLGSSGSTNWRLRLENTGDAEARNVGVTLNEQPIQDINYVGKIAGQETIILGPHNSCGWPLAVCSGFTPPWNAVVTWEDESGQPGQYRTTLTF